MINAVNVFCNGTNDRSHPLRQMFFNDCRGACGVYECETCGGYRVRLYPNVVGPLQKAWPANFVGSTPCERGDIHDFRWIDAAAGARVRP